MYRKIEDVTLRNGEAAELGVLAAPDAEWGPRVRQLLGHKGGDWTWQIEQNLFNAQNGTDGFFYLLSKNGTPFANIMTVEKHGIGCFGHVYTAPEERKKGAADLIHHRQMEDFKARGGRALYLGTDFDSHPFRLYQKYGFTGCEPESGSMFYFAKGQDAFEAEVFAPSTTTVERLAFRHWPLLPALAMAKHPAMIRILGMGVSRVCSTEGGSLPYLAAMAKGDPGYDAHVSVSNASHVPVAIACRRPDTLFGRHVDLVDVFAAPGYEEQIPWVIEALAPGNDRKAVCFADDAWPAKTERLQQAGFQWEGTLKRHFLSQGKTLHDVTVWSRE